jgi:predicted metalloprotease with PDZ domain
MFGYSEAMVPTLDNLKNLLAHEMVHNWPHMNDEPYGECTWYVEGTAEYYSVMLPLRFGMASAEETLEQIQKRSDQYFCGPVRHLSNADAAAQSWTDRRTQRIPYGRGFFYLAGLDARIQRESGGKYSLDDIVLPLTTKWMREQEGTNGDFIRLINELTGLDISEEFTKMAEGIPFIPDADSFDGLFDRIQAECVETDTGNPILSWKWSIRVQ